MYSTIIWSLNNVTEEYLSLNESDALNRPLLKTWKSLAKVGKVVFGHKLNQCNPNICITMDILICINKLKHGNLTCCQLYFAFVVENLNPFKVLVCHLCRIFFRYSLYLLISFLVLSTGHNNLEASRLTTNMNVFKQTSNIAHTTNELTTSLIVSALAWSLKLIWCNPF